MDRQKLAELREKRAAAYAQMDEVLERVGDEPMSPEDQSAYDAAERDFDSHDATIKRAERAAERDRSSDAPKTGDVDDPEREHAHQAETRAERFEAVLDTARRSPANVRAFISSDEYREAFREGVLRGYLGGVAVAPEYRAALDLVSEQRAALNLGVDAEGGYTAPPEFVRELFIEAADEATVRQFARIISTSHGRELQFPQFGEKPIAQWTGAEVVTNPDDFRSEPTFAAPLILEAHPAQAESVTSKDLLQDSVFNIEQIIRELLAEAFAVLTAEAYWTGDGVDKPEGLIPNIVAANVHTGAAGQVDTVTTDDLIDIQHTIKKRYRGNARWFFNDSTLKAVRKLKYPDGKYVWEPSLTEGEPGRILGKPYEVDEYVPDMEASARSIVYGDLKGYAIRDVLALVIQRLTDSAYARRRQVGFLGDIRTDAKMLRPEGIAAYEHPAA